MTTAAPPLIQQHPAEFAQLLELYLLRQPARVLEVGVGHGGTLYHWLREATAGAVVVALDDRHTNRASYLEWAPAGVKLITITGSSQDPDVVLDAARHRPYDWIFIDADHHDHAVRADVRHYGGMADKLGVVALHDVKRSDDPTIHVDELWHELEAEHDTELFSADGGPGIGVVFVGAEGPFFRGRAAT